MAELSTSSGKLERRVLAAAAAAYLMAWAPSWLQPVLLPEILRVNGVTPSAAGFVLTVEMLSLSLSAALYSRLCKGKAFLLILSVAALVTLGGNVLSLVAPSYGLLLVSRAVCGLGEGAAFMVSTAAPARFAMPERLYAKLNVFNIILGLVLLYIAPFVARFFSGNITFPLLAMLSILLFPLLLMMPRQERLAISQPRAQGTAGAAITTPIVLLVCGALLYSAVNGPLWPLFFVIGADIGLDSVTLSHGMTLAIGLALGASLLVGVMGNRLGQVLPVCMGLTLLALASFGSSNTSDPTLFRASMALYVVSLYFIGPYFYGSAATADPSGRGAAAIGSALITSQAVGPYIGGLISERFGYGIIGWLALIANSAAFLAFLAARARLPLWLREQLRDRRDREEEPQRIAR